MWLWFSVIQCCYDCYSKEPKSVNAFGLFTFFRTDLIQSEASWKPSSTSDWLMSAWKNVSWLMEVTSLGSLLKKSSSSSSSSSSSLLSSSRIVLPLLIQGICTVPFPISTSPPPLPPCVGPPNFVPWTKKPEVSGYENCTEQRSHSWFVHSRPLSFVSSNRKVAGHFYGISGKRTMKKEKEKEDTPFSFLSSPPVRISYALPSLILYQLNGNSGCLPFTKRLRKVRLKRQKWNTAFHVVPVESFREQQNIWNGSLVLQKFVFHLWKAFDL